MNLVLEEKVKEIVGDIISVNMLAEQGCTSEVSQIITKNGSYLIKSSFNKKYREWLKQEAVVLEKINELNLIQVPKYYGFIEEIDSSHLIMSFENGITLTSALKNAKNNVEKISLIRSFGQLLCQLHKTQIPTSFDSSTNWLDEQLSKAKYYVESGQTKSSSQLLETLKSNKPLSVKQTFIHGDCTTDNVLVVDGEVRVFIDVSGMTVGDPRYDESLAIRNFVNNDVFKEAFYEGYKRYKVTKDEFKYFDEGLYEFF